MNNKNLFIILLGLLGLWGINHFLSSKNQGSFKTELVALDTAAVSRIVTYPKSENGAEITLKREENGWIATRGNQNVQAMSNSVNGILGILSTIKTKRVAAKSAEKWAEYEVDEGNGTRVVAYENGKQIADFIVGRFNFNQQARTASSYVRLNGEDEVYEVDVFLSMSVGQGFDSYRDKTIIKINAADVTEFTLRDGDILATIAKTANGFTMNDETVLDSTKVATYLSQIATLSGTAFADDFDEISAKDRLEKTLTIRANNMPTPIKVSVYADVRLAKPFVVQSSLNADAFFASDSIEVVGKLFPLISDFYSE